jgi:hypothetical protein
MGDDSSSKEARFRDYLSIAHHPGATWGHWLPFGCLRVCLVTQLSAGDELSVRGRACRQWFGDASESTCIVIADDESKGARAGEQADPPAPC